ncbi:hypothetical protein [Methylobacterium sp. A54F]
MSQPYLSISRLERRFATGNVEELIFEPGVNLLIGRPNTGKTKWLQTLDFLLGDSGDNPFEGAEETGLPDKYDAAAAQLMIGREEVRVERRWIEKGAKTKIFVDEVAMSAGDFQAWLLEKLNIPRLNFPKGNPMSGQTWPELSFRMLLRHIFRQQRFWGGIADQQPDGEQHACLLQFLGLAERVYTDAYGSLIHLRMKAERLKAKRDQFGETLEELARDVLQDPGLTVSVNSSSVKAALARLQQDANDLDNKRHVVLKSAGDQAIPSPLRGRIAQLGEERATIIVRLEEQQRKLKATSDRMDEMTRYYKDLTDELDRLARAEDAGAVLSDLRITHCPACDQSVSTRKFEAHHCFLCDQNLPDETVIEELGAVRLRFESDRLSSELKEADELLFLLRREQKKLSSEIQNGEERLRIIERELLPARHAVSALVQEEVSAIDVELGQLSERERQLGRVLAALGIGDDLTKQIEELEKEIEPLQAEVDRTIQSTDFGAASTLLEDGMNDYLNALNAQKPGIWRHNPINIDISRSGFSIKVGRRRWNMALGGTDTLYFLMAYHYGLLALSNQPSCHYPGIAIIDVPGEFSGEAVEDKENFIVQPFIDLLKREEYKGAQLIMTGASFKGLKDAHFEKLSHVYAS